MKTLLSRYYCFFAALRTKENSSKTDRNLMPLMHASIFSRLFSSKRNFFFAQYSSKETSQKYYKNKLSSCVLLKHFFVFVMLWKLLQSLLPKLLQEKKSKIT